MRKPLANYWTIEIAPTFSHRRDEDGYDLFEARDMTIRAIVYGANQFNFESAVSEYLHDVPPGDADVPFRTSDDGMAGRGIVTREKGRWRLLAVAASFNRIAKLQFTFEDKEQLDRAVAIWHSLEHSPPGWVRKCAEVRPPLTEFCDALDCGWAIHGSRALDAVKRRGQTDEAVAIAIEALHTDQPGVRRCACEALSQLASKSEAVLAALRERLQDECIEVRAWAADALLALGEPPETIVPSMAEGLRTSVEPLPQGEDRMHGPCRQLTVPDLYHAAWVLSMVGQAARPARDVLLERQLDASGDVRLRVAETLLNIGEPLANVLPPLFDGLHSPAMSDRERMRILSALLELGVPASELLPVVSRTLAKSTDFSARIEALGVVQQLGTQAASLAGVIAQLIDAEQDPKGIKLLAARALLHVGRRQKLAESVLLASLRENLPITTYVEILADLGKCQSLEPRSLKRIARNLDDRDGEVQTAAALVLAKHSHQPDRCVPVLIAALGKANDQKRWEIATALGELGKTASAASARLIELVRNDKTREIRMAAVWALVEIGCSLPDVRTLLLEVSGDDAEEQSLIETRQRVERRLRNEGEAT